MEIVSDLLLDILATPNIAAPDGFEDWPLILDNRDHPRQSATASFECNDVLYMI
jgi:hypothetical protein